MLGNLFVLNIFSLITSKMLIAQRKPFQPHLSPMDHQPDELVLAGIKLNSVCPVSALNQLAALWFSTQPNVLSLISEGQSQPHAFSSDTPGQGSDTHFNTSESPYTTDRQTEAVMYIPEQPLLERGCEDVVLRRQLKWCNENLDTCLKNLR